MEPQTESGQAGLVALLLVGAALLGWEILAFAAQSSARRIHLQNGLDAGATAGAAVLADSLNTISVTNGALLAIGVSGLLGNGEAGLWARDLQRFQDETVRRAPGLALLAAEATAASQTGAVVYPERIGGRVYPELMVRRVYFVPVLFGKRFPLWIANDLAETDGLVWGKRRLGLRGVGTAGGGWRTVPLTAATRAVAAGGGGASGIMPMLSLEFHPRLVEDGRVGRK